MARCAICDKGAHFGIKVSHSHRRSNKMWKSNIKSVKVKVNGAAKKMCLVLTLAVCLTAPVSDEEKVLRESLIPSFFMYNFRIYGKGNISVYFLPEKGYTK